MLFVCVCGCVVGFVPVYSYMYRMLLYVGSL